VCTCSHLPTIGATGAPLAVGDATAEELAPASGLDEDALFEVQAVITTMVIAAMTGTATRVNRADGLMATSR
jgi:hypothetical protein